MNNAYGLDAGYFIRLFQRELNPDVVRNQNPDDLARVLLRAARTASEKVFSEPEFASLVAAPQCPPGHELVALPIDHDHREYQPCESVDTAITMLDFGLSFALCNTDHGGTRRDVKKAQAVLEELKQLLAAQKDEDGEAMRLAAEHELVVDYRSGLVGYWSPDQGNVEMFVGPCGTMIDAIRMAVEEITTAQKPA